MGNFKNENRNYWLLRNILLYSYMCVCIMGSNDSMAKKD